MSPEKPRTAASTFVAGALGGLIVLVLGAVLIATDVIDTGDSTTVREQTAISQPASDPSAGGGRTVQDIYRDEGPGVAYIQSEGVSESSVFGQEEGTATGSGFVVDEDGTIVTNAHVVDGADKVTVSFEEGGESIDAEVKGVDPDSDLAVLKIDPGEVEDLTVLPAWRLLGAPGGRPRRRDRQPVRPAAHRDHRNRVRAPAPDQRAERVLDQQRGPDRCLDQPRQLRRPAARRAGPRDRHQLPDRHRRRPGLGRHRLRGAGQHRQGPSSRAAPGQGDRARLPRRVDGDGERGPGERGGPPRRHGRPRGERGGRYPGRGGRTSRLGARRAVGRPRPARATSSSGSTASPSRPPTTWCPRWPACSRATRPSSSSTAAATSAR